MTSESGATSSSRVTPTSLVHRTVQLTGNGACSIKAYHQPLSKSVEKAATAQGTKLRLWAHGPVGFGVHKNYRPCPTPLCRKCPLCAATGPADTCHTIPTISELGNVLSGCMLVGAALTEHGNRTLQRSCCVLFLPSQAHRQTFDSAVAFDRCNWRSDLWR